MKQTSRKRLQLEREAVRVLVSAVSAADLGRVQGGQTSCDECSNYSCLEVGCRPSTEPGP